MSETYDIEWGIPIGPQIRRTAENYPWEKLPAPRMMTITDDDGDEIETLQKASFFVPKQMKNPSALIAKVKERFPEADFEWRRTIEEMEIEEEVIEDGNVTGSQKVVKPVHGVRFWRTK
jgi:hypothetical protein